MASGRESEVRGFKPQYLWDKNTPKNNKMISSQALVEAYHEEH